MQNLFGNASKALANLITAMRTTSFCLEAVTTHPSPSPAVTYPSLSYHYDMLEITNDGRAWLAKQTMRIRANFEVNIQCGSGVMPRPPGRTDCAHSTWWLAERNMPQRGEISLFVYRGGCRPRLGVAGNNCRRMPL